MKKAHNVWPRVCSLYLLFLGAVGSSASDRIFSEMLLRITIIAVAIFGLIKVKAGIPYLALVLLILIPYHKVGPPTLIDLDAARPSSIIVHHSAWPPISMLSFELGNSWVDNSGTYQSGINLIPALLLYSLKPNLKTSS